MAASSTTIDLTSTSLPGHTGAITPSTFSGSMGPEATVVAILTAGDIVVTATQVASTTGLAVIDGTTLTWRQQGITLSNGDVVSLGFNGLEDSTTTAYYQAMTVGGSSAGGSSSTPTSQTVVVTQSSTTSTTSTNAPTQTSGSSPTTGSSTNTASAASTSSSGIAPMMGAGKALALLGALGGMVAFGL